MQLKFLHDNQVIFSILCFILLSINIHSNGVIEELDTLIFTVETETPEDQPSENTGNPQGDPGNPQNISEEQHEFEESIDDGFWGAEASENDKPVSRESGIAPMAVHFFSEFASEKNTGYRFRHYDYTWDFDDPKSGFWGTSNQSKNTAKGAAAVHIFEEPGQYNVKLTILNEEGVISTESYEINVSDPDSFYSGSKTVYVSDTRQNDFDNVPENAIKISTDDLEEIVKYAQPGNRILFNRGSSWIIDGLNWPSNSGPVHIGAYGTGSNPDSLGIYENDPKITVREGTFLPLSKKQNWSISHLHLVDDSQKNSSFGGSMDIQHFQFNRLKIEGFKSGISWDHWNTRTLMQKDDIVISSCHISGSDMAGIYGGGERLAIIGNVIQDSNKSHVIRVWQAYRSVISHNIVTGSSLDTTQGKHALKLHGPGFYHNGEGTTSLGVPAKDTGLRALRTNFTIVSCNTFGSSGPWPVSIGPQNNVADERLTNIVFEYNQVHSDYGQQSSRKPELGINIKCQDITIRNNIFDGTGAAASYQGIVVNHGNAEPLPTGVEIYNNTIYRGDFGKGLHRGIKICEEATGIVVMNNLVSFPKATGIIELISFDPENMIKASNLLTENDIFISPDDPDPLKRDFSLITRDEEYEGSMVPIYDDFNGEQRQNFLIGAIE